MKIAVVTGGARGIGLEICRQLVAQGLLVVLTARDREKARRVAGTLGGDAIPFDLDVTAPGGAERLVEFLDGEMGGVDVLVNNAGVFLDRGHGGLDVPMELVRESLETNLVGPWRLSQALAPIMKRRGYGRIVNVSSGMGAMSERTPEAHTSGHKAPHLQQRYRRGRVSQIRINRPRTALISASVPL